MHFDLVDRVLEQSAERIVTIKAVTSAEEYLQDHFPTFPVLPGVLMLEAMVQAGRRLLAGRDAACSRHVLGGVRALKYGTFVRPGDRMMIEVAIVKAGENGVYELKGSGQVRRVEASGDESSATCVSGRFTLRPVA